MDNQSLAILFDNKHGYKVSSDDLEHFFQVNLNMFCIADLHGKFIKLNQKWEQVLGYSIEELEQINYLDLIHPDDLASTRQVLVELGEQKEVVNFINRYRTKNGDYRFIEWQCMPNGELVYTSSRDITDLKLQEEKIESQEKFRQIVDNIGGIFWLLSADKKELLYVSSNYKKVHGKEYSYTDNPFQPLLDIVYPPDRGKIDKAISRFLEDGHFSEEFRVINPDQQIHWVTSSSFPVLDSKGNVQRYAGLFQDITERKNIELSEREKTSRLNAIIQAMPDLLFIISDEGEYLDVFSTDVSKLAAPPEQIIGKNIRDFFPDQSEYLFQLFRESIKEQKVVTGTYTLELNGELLHFEARITPMGDTKILSVVRNVTELVNTTERLRFQTRMQQLLVKITNTYINLPAEQLDEALNESIRELGEFICADRFYIFDYRENEHAFFNTHEWCSPGIEPQIEYLQGTPADELSDWLEIHKRGEIMLIHDVMALDSNDPIRMVLEQQDIKSIITVPFIDKGTYTGFVGIDSVHTMKLFDEDEQQLLKVFAQTIVSVRQRIRAQLELEKALDRAQESDRLKSAFLATISHELRTPLNHVLGFSELISVASKEPDIREYAEDIHRSGSALLTMIEDVFSLALTEQSEIVVRQNAMKGVELFMNARSVLNEMLSSSMKNERIGLVFRPDSELMKQNFITDRQKIHKVLSILFSNAVKFTDSGSIEFGARRIDDCIEMYVKDTGIGIDPENQKYIFNIFRQLDDSHSRRYDGLGIGLSIARKIADVLDATIRVESIPGKGSTFYFTVPVQFV